MDYTTDPEALYDVRVLKSRQIIYLLDLAMCKCSVWLTSAAAGSVLYSMANEESRFACCLLRHNDRQHEGHKSTMFSILSKHKGVS